MKGKLTENVQLGAADPDQLDLMIHRLEVMLVVGRVDMTFAEQERHGASAWGETTQA